MATREDTARKTASYVYGIAQADVEPDPKAGGVGNPPSSVTTVRHGDIAALVSEIPVDEPLGRPEDLNAHAQLLDSAAATHPVLPMRFGAVLAGPDAVADELLAAGIRGLGPPGGRSRTGGGRSGWLRRPGSGSMR